MLGPPLALGFRQGAIRINLIEEPAHERIAGGPGEFSAIVPAVQHMRADATPASHLIGVEGEGNGNGLSEH
jgi:hypothetical protein